MFPYSGCCMDAEELLPLHTTKVSYFVYWTDIGELLLLDNVSLFWLLHGYRKFPYFVCWWDIGELPPPPQTKTVSLFWLLCFLDR
jgi:hypothetical protein